jgi:hypothetical protein
MLCQRLNACAKGPVWHRQKPQSPWFGKSSASAIERGNEVSRSLPFVICHLLSVICLVIHSTRAASIEPRITSVVTTKICALTGPQALVDQKSPDVCGTDLGIMTELNGRIYFAFGDTFGYEGDICRGINGPNWRSNCFASTTFMRSGRLVVDSGQPSLAEYRRENIRRLRRFLTYGFETICLESHTLADQITNLTSDLHQRL